ncbi:MAG: Patatin [Oscillospiraceae bacterium]|jgi:NTE family protein|nr:Patatin [Oscillospiraceae bacterium]
MQLLQRGVVFVMSGFSIALSGGGAACSAHVGVLTALHENGLIPNAVSGTSSGSIIASLFAMGLTTTDLKYLIKQFAKKRNGLVDTDIWGIIKAIFQLITGQTVTLPGLLKGNALEKLMLKYTGGINIKDVEIPIVIPAVDIHSGKTVAYTNSPNHVSVENVIWKQDVDLAAVIRASCSFPAVFRPKDIDGMCLVDGGVTHNLPVDLLCAIGGKNVIAVDVSEIYVEPDVDNIFEVTSHSFMLMRSELTNYTAKCELLTIKPPMPKEMGLLSFCCMERCFEIGYDTASTFIPVIKSLVE